MSREIRRVPLDWEHPTYYNKHRKRVEKKGLHRGDFDLTQEMANWQEELREWLSKYNAWIEGLYENEHMTYLGNGQYKYHNPAYVGRHDEHYNRVYDKFEEFESSIPMPPDPWDYMVTHINERPCDGYQVYETVTEGTPVSPVFANREELLRWLISQGHSETAANDFIDDGWAPTAVFANGQLAMGIDALELLKPKKEGT
jgi:hypothetical protein